jgi:hypothetical protein
MKERYMGGEESTKKDVVLYFHQECILEPVNWKIYSKLSKFFLYPLSLSTLSTRMFIEFYKAFHDVHFLFLFFCRVELKAQILGPPDLFVKSGSEITLTCKLQQGPHDLGTIYWYKGKHYFLFRIKEINSYCRVIESALQIVF